ncbi:hypothetical protein ECP029894211_5336 [Escherichia coli P0298942.11]|nr:hypothetical protein ECP029894211_5336 [Escherichia coli P0298942.11]
MLIKNPISGNDSNLLIVFYVQEKTSSSGILEKWVMTLTY